MEGEKQRHLQNNIWRIKFCNTGNGYAWSETSLPTLLYNYDLKEIYNADEFGLFYQCVPNTFVIGKAQKPRCFKNVKFLSSRYRHQKMSWMDGILFEEWVRELDRIFYPKEEMLR